MHRRSRSGCPITTDYYQYQYSSTVMVATKAQHHKHEYSTLRLKQSAWGKGYTTEICMRLLAFAFKDTLLMDMVACIDDDNNKSQQVLSKCGLRCEGRRRAYGGQSLCFRITREQWMFENRA